MHLEIPRLVDFKRGMLFLTISLISENILKSLNLRKIHISNKNPDPFLLARSGSGSVSVLPGPGSVFNRFRYEIVYDALDPDQMKSPGILSHMSNLHLVALYCTVRTVLARFFA